MANEFSAQVEAWIAKSKNRTLAVLRESAQRVVSAAQSRIPVDTGFARASVRASLSEMPPIVKSFRGEAGKSYSYDGGAIAAVLASAQLGDTVYVGWTASYVGLLEYGHSKQAPTGFVAISAMEWPRHVAEATAELRARTGQ